LVDRLLRFLEYAGFSCKPTGLVGSPKSVGRQTSVIDSRRLTDEQLTSRSCVVRPRPVVGSVKIARVVVSDQFGWVEAHGLGRSVKIEGLSDLANPDRDLYDTGALPPGVEATLASRRSRTGARLHLLTCHTGWP
jgi:hypothetical protein